MSFIGALPKALAALIYSHQDIRRVVSDAGLDPTMMLIQSIPPAIVWALILEQAEQQGAVDSIIAMASNDFPDSQELIEAVNEYSRSAHEHPGLSSPPLEVIPVDSAISVGSMRFRYIPRATSWIGSDDGYEHERPRHRVRHSPFFLQETPVTNTQFSEFCVETGWQTSAELGTEALVPLAGVWQPLPGATWRFPQGPDGPPARAEHPVVQVNWYDAALYSRWLSQRAALEIGLPTEVQWEYAGGGSSGLRWPFGNSYEPDTANIEGSATTPVASFPANPLGLWDMAGNAQEWCADWYAPSWLAAGHDLSHPTEDPGGPGSGTYKILRGGSWSDSPQHCRCANRFSARPWFSACNWGFRCRVSLTDSLIAALVANARWPIRAEDMKAG